MLLELLSPLEFSQVAEREQTQTVLSSKSKGMKTPKDQQGPGVSKTPSSFFTSFNPLPLKTTPIPEGNMPSIEETKSINVPLQITVEKLNTNTHHIDIQRSLAPNTVLMAFEIYCEK